MNFLVLDGETCNTPKIDGQLDVKNGQVYDLGGMVIDEYGNEKTRFSVINGDVFFGMPNQMREAYYSDKIPQYIKEINMGKRKVLNTWQIVKMVRAICKEYKVQAIVAHNAYFDIQTLKNKGYSIISPVIITNTEDFNEISNKVYVALFLPLWDENY